MKITIQRGRTSSLHYAHLPPAAQICAQAFTFLLAGYETTANALAFTTYLLACNPDKEAKMLQEIDAFGRDAAPGYDDLAKVPLSGRCWFPRCHLVRCQNKTPVPAMPHMHEPGCHQPASTHQNDKELLTWQGKRRACTEGLSPEKPAPHSMPVRHCVVLTQFPYVDAVLKEALRLEPPAGFGTIRELREVSTADFRLVFIVSVLDPDVMSVVDLR